MNKKKCSINYRSAMHGIRFIDRCLKNMICLVLNSIQTREQETTNVVNDFYVLVENKISVVKTLTPCFSVFHLYKNSIFFFICF